MVIEDGGRNLSSSGGDGGGKPHRESCIFGQLCILLLGKWEEWMGVSDGPSSSASASKKG